MAWHTCEGQGFPSGINGRPGHRRCRTLSPPDGVAPPTAWTIGVLAVPRSSLRFQTKKLRPFFCQDTSEDDSFFGPLFSKARVFVLVRVLCLRLRLLPRVHGTHHGACAATGRKSETPPEDFTGISSRSRRPLDHLPFTIGAARAAFLDGVHA